MKKEYLVPDTAAVPVSAEKLFMASYNGNASGSDLSADPTELTDEQMTNIFG